MVLYDILKAKKMLGGSESSNSGSNYEPFIVNFTLSGSIANPKAMSDKIIDEINQAFDHGKHVYGVVDVYPLFRFHTQVLLTPINSESMYGIWEYGDDILCFIFYAAYSLNDNPRNAFIKVLNSSTPDDPK